MFKKALFAKFEYEGLPKPLTDISVENLLFKNEQKIAVTMWGSHEFWSEYTADGVYDELYGTPTSIIVSAFKGGQKSTTDFVLFRDMSLDGMTSDKLYVKAYSNLLNLINHALRQHVRATELVATVYAASAEEAKKLKNIYADFSGVKIVQSQLNNPLEFGHKVDIVQFTVTPRGAELEQLKHDVCNDLFLRLGVYTGLEKTHVTNDNLHNSEQVIDLINAFELKSREDFCRRVTEWRCAHGNDTPLRVKIHEITTANTVDKDLSRSVAQTPGSTNNDEV